MVSISGNENELKRQIAIRRREDVNLPPRDIEANCRICLNCNRTVNAEIDELARDPDCLKLNVLKQTTNNSCMFCDGLHNISRLSVECRVQSLYHKKYLYTRISSLLSSSFRRQWICSTSSVGGFAIL